MKCPKCESTQISKNGHHRGKQNYICKQCGRQFVESYELRGYSNDAKRICLRMRANGMGYRAIERETGISHNTIINWVKEANRALVGDSEAEENSEIALELEALDWPLALII
jgi:transposase-like protein